MSTAKIEVFDGGVTLRPSAERFAEWTRHAGGQPIVAWLEAIADAEAAQTAVRTWPVSIQLKHPVELGSQHITHLELRRGRLADIKGMKLSGEMPTEHLITIASRLSGQTTQVIERLDAEDAGEVMAIAIDFYGTCLGGGKTRSR